MAGHGCFSHYTLLLQDHDSSSHKRDCYACDHSLLPVYHYNPIYFQLPQFKITYCLVSLTDYLKWNRT